MKKYALIVAGGRGMRMGGPVPKQFIEIAGKPVLFWTIEKFFAFDAKIGIIVVLPEDQFGVWGDLCEKLKFKLPVTLAGGGHSRFQSVKNGLALLQGDGIVFIHDGVRPLVSQDTIVNCYQTALAHGNALPVVPVVESIRKTDGKNSRHVDRSKYRLVQTPQTFRLPLIKNAYLQNESEFFTDDASVCEAAGEKIFLVNGNPENIKITTAVDLVLAQALLKKTM